jgi:hypothetical protein
MIYKNRAEAEKELQELLNMWQPGSIHRKPRLARVLDEECASQMTERLNEDTDSVSQILHDYIYT